MTAAASKPAALLRLMAERRGQRINARDVAALLLAARTLEVQAQEIDKSFLAYGTTLRDLVTHKADAEAMRDHLRAILEIHT